jgi:hypothetical protein
MNNVGKAVVAAACVCAPFILVHDDPKLTTTPVASNSAAQAQTTQSTATATSLSKILSVSNDRFEREGEGVIPLASIARDKEVSVVETVANDTNEHITEIKGKAVVSVMLFWVVGFSALGWFFFKIAERM